MWLIGVWLSGCKEQERRVLVMQDLCNVGMIAWVVLLH